MNGSLTTTELKKPHPPRMARGVETWNRPVLHPCMVDKNSKGYFRSEESHSRYPKPEFQCQEDKYPKLLAGKTSGD